MKIEITDGLMVLDDGAVIATATRTDGGPTVTAWLGCGAVTALALAERLAAGYGGSDPFAGAWRAELGRG
jgi:hypothetical protein